MDMVCKFLKSAFDLLFNFSLLIVECFYDARDYVTHLLDFKLAQLWELFNDVEVVDRKH